MSKVGLIALLICGNFIIFGLILGLVWFLVSGAFDRVWKRFDQRSKFYSMPRKLARDYIRRGYGLRLAREFLAQVCSGKPNDNFENRAEISLSGEVLDLQQSMWCAMVDLYCNKQVWRRYLKKFPAYIDIEGLDFSVAIDKFGGCIRKYEQL